jgi:hypothetical protein
MDKLKRDLLLSGYPIHFISSKTNTPMEISHPKNLEKHLASVFISYVKGVCGKFT